jgi:hypothetical protein
MLDIISSVQRSKFDNHSAAQASHGLGIGVRRRLSRDILMSYRKSDVSRGVMRILHAEAGRAENWLATGIRNSRGRAWADTDHA